MVEITSEEQNKGKGMKRIEDSLRDLWDNIKCTNIRFIGVPEKEGKKYGEGNDNPLQYSCLENPMDGGTW